MTKISQLPADSAPTSDDYVVMNDSTSGQTKRVLLSDLDTQVYNALPSGVLVQEVSTLTSTAATGSGASSVIPNDNTIPQNTEGVEFMTCSITPKSATNILEISVVTFLSNGNATQILTTALFQDTTANALAVAVCFSGANTIVPFSIPMAHTMTAGTTSSTTFKVRAGSHQNTTTTFNGVSGASVYGAITKSSIIIREIRA